MTALDNLERVEPAHMLDAIYGWVAFHAGRKVRHLDYACRLKEPERTRIESDLNPTKYPCVVVAVGAALSYYTVAGPNPVEEVRMTATTLTVCTFVADDVYTLVGDDGGDA
jgi:hypothetical protein